MAAVKEHKYDNHNPMLFSLLPRGESFLDVGCGGGTLMGRLRDEKAARVEGLELDPALIALCESRGLSVRRADLEQPEALELPAGRWQNIVASDILEHLRRPERLLKALKPGLAPGGRLWVGLPNVAFIQVRLSLLLGRFNYNPQGGILDDEHLRFYTRSSGRALLEGCGYRVERIHSCNVVRARYGLLRPLGRMMPGLFSIQNIYEAVA
jgi:methionine biosynthesis protein MetW